MKIHWSNRAAGDPTGNRLGYATASNGFLHELERVGALDDDADTAVYFGTPYNYRPVENSRNFIFTMWESVDVPDAFKYAFEIADGIIVPSTFCKEILQPHTDKEIHVCPLGIDTKAFQPKVRIIKNKFRWGWVGAPNFRKYSLLGVFHRDLLGPLSARGICELYMKTTGMDESRFVLDCLNQDIPVEWDNRAKIIKGPGWVIDNRKVPVDELAKIYRSFHGFLSLHIGEGFGLTTLEAMATGCPVIVTGYSGTNDFCNESNSYPVKYKLGRHNFSFDTSPDKDEGTVLGALPDAEDVVCKIADVMTDYPRALQKGAMAAATAKKFGWSTVVRHLLQIVSLPVGREIQSTPKTE